MSTADLEEEREDPASRDAHPSLVVLERFMRCEMESAEQRAIVRHLLAGCEKCRSVTARLWNHGSKLPISLINSLVNPSRKHLRRRRARAAKWDPRMRAAVDALTGVTREILQEQVKVLEDVQERLELLAAGLSVAPVEDAASADVAEEIRAIIACVLQDEILPAIDDLRAAAEHRARSDDDEGPEAA